MYASQVPAGELFVFRDRSDALDWLGVRSTDLPALKDADASSADE
jgi:hypothetical protein